MATFSTIKYMQTAKHSFNECFAVCIYNIEIYYLSSLINSFPIFNLKYISFSDECHKD